MCTKKRLMELCRVRDSISKCVNTSVLLDMEAILLCEILMRVKDELNKIEDQHKVNV